MSNDDELRQLKEKFERDIQHVQMQSTYKTDFTGMQQLTNVLPENNFIPEWKRQAEYKLDTEQRFQYQQKVQTPLTRNNVSRYGCNERHKTPAIGVTPNFSPFWYEASKKQ